MWAELACRACVWHWSPMCRLSINLNQTFALELSFNTLQRCWLLILDLSGYYARVKSWFAELLTATIVLGRTSACLLDGSQKSLAVGAILKAWESDGPLQQICFISFASLVHRSARGIITMKNRWKPKTIVLSSFLATELKVSRW